MSTNYPSLAQVTLLEQLPQFFNPSYYVQQNADVLAAVSKGYFTSPWQHFLQYGQYENRAPDSFFNPTQYLINNPDVLAAVANGTVQSAYLHFIQYGIAEDRNDGNFTGSFNDAAYLLANPDVQAAVTKGYFINGYQHWLEYGQFEGRAAYSTTGALITPTTGGQTYTLTTNIDNIVATGSNNTIVGTVVGLASPNSTLNPGDAINGGGGTNTLKIIDTAGNGANSNDLAGVTLTNVQVISLQNASNNTAAIDLTLYPSVSKVIALNTANNKTDSFTSLASGAQVVASGAGTGTGTFVNFAYTTATTAVSVGVDGGANGVTFTSTNGTETAATISSTGATNGTTAAPDIFNLTNNGNGGLKTLTVNAASNLVANLNNADYAATAALTVTGVASNVTLGSTTGAQTEFKTITASGLTVGGLTITADATVLTSFTGGTGNDTLTLNGVLAAGSTINLGAGNNTLLGTTAVATSTSTTINGGGTSGTNTVSSGLINAGNAGQFTNFQDLSLQSVANTSFNVSLVSGITALSVDTVGQGNVTYTNLTTSQALTDTFVGNNGANTNTLSFSGLSGTSNAYTIAFNGAAQTAAPAAANVILGTVSAQGINNFTIASGGGTNTWNSLNLGADTTANTVNITGSQNLNVTFAGFGSLANSNTGVSSINASATTGNVTIDTTGVTAANGATNALVNGLTVTAGSGTDTLIAITNATLTGGSGVDTFNALNFNNSAASLANVTNFVAGTDKLTVLAGTSALVPGGNDTFTQTAQNIGAATSLAAALNTATVAGQITWFQFGGNTFVDEAGSATATGAFNAGAGATNAHVIELTGAVSLAKLTLNNAGNTLA